jgi:NAD dependent epimerase/dehydratase family enzyme
VAPNALRQKELTTVIASTLKKPLWLPAVPEWVLKLILGEMSAVVLQSQHVISAAIEGSDFKFQFHSAKEALEDLLIY